MLKKRGRKKNMPDKKIFEILYYNESTSAKDLANTYGVAVQSIYNYAYKLRKTQDKDIS